MRQTAESCFSISACSGAMFWCKLRLKFGTVVSCRQTERKRTPEGTLTGVSWRNRSAACWPSCVLPLLLLSGWRAVHLLVLPLSDMLLNAVCTRCTFELFQETGWSLVDLRLHTFPFVRENPDSPGSTLPIQDRFRIINVQEYVWYITTTCSTFCL